ncbi:MAG: DUF5597 domain-containing protein [Prevotella sp.]|jgi:hypothetical protein
MRNRLLLVLLTLLPMGLWASVRLQRQGSATQLVVNGNPMLVLGGELSNSAVTSPADIDSVMPRVRRMGLNTVFVPAYWNLTEPEEGKFDFSLVDEVIRQARANDLKVVFLWFGAWKNSMSCYAPMWFKCDTRRFPRAMTVEGKPMEIASAFSEEVLKADCRAFTRLVKHVSDIDRQESTVIMWQIENEIGMLESARDYSPLAEKAWRGQVPDDVKRALGIKQGRGTWAQLVGTDLYAEEKFQAYYYARYVEVLSKAAKEIMDIPVYVNAAMNSRGRKPGEYPSAGPLAHLLPIWKAAAPHIDIYAPDIYDKDFKMWVGRYKRNDNPFFTPETRMGTYSGVRAFYCFGAVDAMSFSPFAIDQASPQVAREITESYRMLSGLSPLILSHQGKEGIWGVLFSKDDQEKVLSDGNVTLTCRHYFTLPWDPRATDGSAWPEGGALIIRLSEMEYLIAGKGVVVTFQSPTELQQTEKVVRGEDGFVEKGTSENDGAGTLSSVRSVSSRFSGKRIGIGFVNQVEVDENGRLKYLRQENGDQSHQGRHARIGVDDYKILHVKLYEY